MMNLIYLNNLLLVYKNVTYVVLLKLYELVAIELFTNSMLVVYCQPLCIYKSMSHMTIKRCYLIKLVSCYLLAGSHTEHPWNLMNKAPKSLVDDRIIGIIFGLTRTVASAGLPDVMRNAPE